MPATLSASTDFIQISFINQLFAAVNGVFALSHQSDLSSLALSLGKLLLEPGWELENDNVRSEWVAFVATLCLASEQLLDGVFDIEFLDAANVRVELWREITKQWTNQEVMPWDAISLICGAPFEYVFCFLFLIQFADFIFREETGFTLSDDDWSNWNAVVRTAGRADEVGRSSLLDSIAAKLDKTHK